jgi:hypothetical protein
MAGLSERLNTEPATLNKVLPAPMGATDNLKKPMDRGSLGAVEWESTDIRARDWRWERLESLRGRGGKPHYAPSRTLSFLIEEGGGYIYPKKTFHALSWASWSVFPRKPKELASPLTAKAENLAPPNRTRSYGPQAGARTRGGGDEPHEPHEPHWPRGPDGHIDQLTD